MAKFKNIEYLKQGNVKYGKAIILIKIAL